MDDDKPLMDKYRRKLDYTNFRHPYEGSTADVSALLEQADVDMCHMVGLMHATGGVALRHTSFADDGYAWFAELRYRVDGRRVSVYFPFQRDEQLDRPVEVRAEHPVAEESIKGLLHKIGKELAELLPEE